MRQSVQVPNALSVGLCLSGVYAHTANSQNVTMSLLSESFAHSILLSGMHLFVREI